MSIHLTFGQLCEAADLAASLGIPIKRSILLLLAVYASRMEAL